MKTRRAIRTGAGALVAAAVLFVMTGCMKMNVDFKIEGDYVNGTMIMAVDKKLAAMSGQTEDQLVDEMTKDAPDEPGVTSEKYDDGTFVGKKYIFDKTPLDKMSDNSDADELKIVHDKAAKTYTVTGTMDLTEIKNDDPTTAAMMGSLDIKIAITFPGKVREHNGELNGTTVTWKPKAGEKTELKAVAEEASGLAALTGGSSSNTTLIAAAVGGGVLLLIIIIVVIVLLSRRKKQPAYPTDAYGAQAGYPAPAQGGYPGSPGGYPAPTGSPAGYPTAPQPGGYPAPGSPVAPQSGGGVYGGQQGQGYPQPQQPNYPPQQPQYPPQQGQGYQQTQPYQPPQQGGWPPNQPGA
ncbi:LppM family (lipo)protein [Luedemannella helvata]|uniref:LppM domain-containing protein n=1 Tax=Luedemannella helvata TaxID=349315 RepID=A0ABP4WS84_9ACTN